MQQSWRTDADKLTFIVCLPLRRDDNISIDSNRGEDVHVRKQEDLNSTSLSTTTTTITEQDDTPDRMLGDVNLFLRFDEDDNKIIGEIELMIAEKQNQRRGFGRAALISFLRYIIDHESEIVDEFLSQQQQQGKQQTARLSCLSVKIGQSNARSLALFESLGFRKVSDRPSYFGEFELRRSREELDQRDVREMLWRFGVEGYVEVGYYDRK